MGRQLNRSLTWLAPFLNSSSPRLRALAVGRKRGCVHFLVSWKTRRIRKASSTAAADPRRTSGTVLPPRLAAANRAFRLVESRSQTVLQVSTCAISPSVQQTRLLSYLPISHPASVTDPHTPPIEVLSRTPQLNWTGAWQKNLARQSSALSAALGRGGEDRKLKVTAWRHIDEMTHSAKRTPRAQVSYHLELVASLSFSFLLLVDALCTSRTT
ncbi:BQ5605_C005g03654 [Microbotryum silenes-dioicae]|uniref:BQ5605_C005g03654 protein n=1 Tax=Microbotryum silenes-dioicae TaxID=796604 RepID=A0A2X0MYD5_9BASI|nr:BQ5605_C005g03654 [Microbotryum silenes-dioicae]